MYVDCLDPLWVLGILSTYIMPIVLFKWGRAHIDRSTTHASLFALNKNLELWGLPIDPTVKVEKYLGIKSQLRERMNRIFPLESTFFENSQVWAFRISNVEDLSLDKTFEGFSARSPSRLIVSEETSSKGVIHHHGLVVYDDTCKKAFITEVIRSIYPDAAGNKSIYTAIAEKKGQLLKYTIKEGKYKCMGFSKEYIDAALRCSDSKEGMKKQFSDLLDLYRLAEVSFHDYMVRYIELKVRHNQPIYKAHLEAYFTGIMMRSNREQIVRFVRRMEEYNNFNI